MLFICKLMSKHVSTVKSCGVICTSESKLEIKNVYIDISVYRKIHKYINYIYVYISNMHTYTTRNLVDLHV
jgi:hypothetical protein